MLSNESGVIKKTCFVIAPIGQTNSSIRRKIDGLMDEVFIPILDELGCSVEIAHRIAAPGRITNQIMTHIIGDDLVIADLSGLNPNVMYELAIRHAINKPVIQICETETRLPFDVSDERTIFFDDDVSGIKALKNQLRKTIQYCFENNAYGDNPVLYALRELDILRATPTTDARRDLGTHVIDRLDQLEASIGDAVRPRNRLNNPIRVVMDYTVTFSSEPSKGDIHQRAIIISQTLEQLVPDAALTLDWQSVNEDTRIITLRIDIITPYLISQNALIAALRRCETPNCSIAVGSFMFHPFA